MTHPVPLNPDGTPNFGGIGGAGKSQAGAVNIWGLSSDLTDYLDSTSGGKIWFDVGQKTRQEQLPEYGSAYNEQVSGANGAPAFENTPPSKSLKATSSYDVMRKPAQVMAQFAAMSFYNKPEFMALQKALASGPWGSVHLNGAWDSYTEKALGNAMLQYVKLSMGAGVGVSFTDYLLQTGAEAQALGGDGTSLGSGGGSQRAPFQASLTDPASIRAAAQTAFQQALGHGASKSQLDKFVAQFQSAQTGAEQNAYNNKGTITSPDLSSEAMQFAQQGNPQEYQQNQRQSFLNTLVDMFAPSGSQRPNMTPVPKV